MFRCFNILSEYEIILLALITFRFVSFRNSTPRRSHWKCSMKKAVVKNFAMFTGKHLCWSLFFHKETPAQVFSSEYCEIFKSISSEEHLRTAVSGFQFV